MPHKQPPDANPNAAMTGQIVRLYADVATVEVDGTNVEAAIRGKLFRGDPPAVGDYVSLSMVGNGFAITGVLPRRSVLARRAAGSTSKRQVLIANIDQVIIVFAAVRPEPHLPMLDRFLVAVEANNLQARIVLNKLDLVHDAAARELLAPYEQIGYPVHYTSVRENRGLDELRDSLVGKASVLVGPSGVGKSSLLNSLFPGLDLKVGQISEAYGKGRHTTVGGLLLHLPQNVTVADTAGLREVGLWMIPPDELADSFPEFRPHMSNCRFSDCRHLAEPDCAVHAAVERGEIPSFRYDSYVKLRAEAEEAWPKW